MKTNKFLWRIHPARALAEAGLIGLLFFLFLASQVGRVSPYVVGNGMLFLCGLCGMWTVLRARLPGGNWLWQGIWELVVGFVLSLMVTLGVHLIVRLMDWQELWRQSNLGGTISVTFVLLATGPGYVIARLGVRFWLLWEHMRRRRMLWAITHAHLTVVVLVIALGVLASVLLISFSGGVDSTPSEKGWFTFFVERVLHTIFPAVGVIVFMTMLALMALLPPSALFSFWVARKTTRRLEKLAAATGALRDGDYQTRVGVEGEDEVARLSKAFNSMTARLQDQRSRIDERTQQLKVKVNQLGEATRRAEAASRRGRSRLTTDASDGESVPGAAGLPQRLPRRRRHRRVCTE